MHTWINKQRRFIFHTVSDDRSLCKPWNFGEIIGLLCCYFKSICSWDYLLMWTVSFLDVSSCLLSPHCIILTGGTWECRTLWVVCVGILFSLCLPSLGCLSLSFSWPNPAHFLPLSLPISLTIILKDVSIPQEATVSPSKRSKTVTKFGPESQTHIKIQAWMHIWVSLLIEFGKDEQSLSDSSWDPWSRSSQRDFLFYQSFNL